MTTYYVRTTSGSNSNNGLTPATAWLTIGKALGHTGLTSPVVGGDIIYIGAGYYRETVLVGGGTFTSPASVVQFIGDVTGANTGDAGEIIWTGYTTSDTAAPSSSSTLNLNSRGNLTFDSISLIAGAAANSPVTSSGGVANCANVTFKRCFIFSPAITAVTLTMVADTNMNWLFDKCIISGYGSHTISVSSPTSTLADYNIGLTIRNSLLVQGSGFNGAAFSGTGAGSFKPGGASILDCSFFGGASVIRTVSAGTYSTTIPITVYNSIFEATGVAVNAATSGHIVEDFNHFSNASPRTNVTAGTNSKVGNVLYPGIHMGQELLYGFIGRPFAMPTIASPLLGFGNSGSVTPPTDDLLGRNRPEGGGSTSNAIGALERHDTARQETTTVRTGANAINITGPGSHDFQMPVDAFSTTVTVYGRYDTTHAATNKPQMMVVNGEQCGVSAATATMTVGVDTWEQLSLTFTPTSQGIVTIRLVSRAAGGAGKAFFDDFNVA